MTANRRTFTRELLALMPVVETEFSGQIKVHALEELNVNEVIVEITPLKGYYAHASFLFRMTAPSDYPLVKPDITCLTGVFHPNIDSDPMRNNICLNLLNQWNPRFGLRDVFYALLFLFYEPNFDDPMNHSCVKPEEGLTMEETIRKSFHGGRVNDVVYEPNESWLRWAEENGVSFSAPSVAKDGCEITQDPSIASPTRLDSTISDCFHRALSGIYSPMDMSMFHYYSYNREFEISVNFAYVCSVTVRPASSSSDVSDLLYDTQRYYYLEQCDYSQGLDLRELTAQSVSTSMMERYAVLFRSQQVSFCVIPTVWPKRCVETFSEDVFDHQPSDDTEESGAQECEQNNNGSECSAERLPFDSAAPVDEAVEESEPMNFASVPDTEEHEDSDLQLTSNVEDGDQLNESVGLPEEAAEEEHSDPCCLAVVSDDVIHAAEGNDDPQDQWEAVSDVEVNNEEDERSESASIEYADILYQLTHQRELIADLRPWWWIFYQSRWPGYLAPRHLLTVKGRKCKRLYARASSIVLRCDLYRLGVRFKRPTLFLLVDSLSLSPCSPMLNRAVTFRGCPKKSVHWYSLDWYSVWDAIRPYDRGSRTPRTHFYAPMLVFGLCYLHNWLAYMSRVELYGSCLGYSRPLNAGVVTSAAATCLTIASLGCGQCGVLDMWPLWLMWRLCRQLCRLAVFCCSRPIWPGEEEEGSSRGIRTRVCFPFSDLDEI